MQVEKLPFSAKLYRLGPFKYEPLNAVPHVGLIVDFASPEELSRIRERARGHMKSTPLRTNNQVEDYTRHRTRFFCYLSYIPIYLSEQVCEIKIA
jgi:hypothetical protein